MLEFWQIFTGLLLLIPVLLYYYIQKSHQYWGKKGVYTLKPHPIFGHSAETFLHSVSGTAHWHRIYKETEGHKYVGYYRFHRPMFLVRDPELVKHILTKDFPYFSDRFSYLANPRDLLTQHLFTEEGDKWKRLRAKLTPTFSSGKLKQMFPLMVDCANILGEVLADEVKKNPVLEMKDMAARYTTDVISSCAFGLQVNSLKNAEAEFRKQGRRVFEVNFKRKIFFLLMLIWPKLPTSIGIDFNAKDLIRFFVNIISETVNYREANNVVRNDFINIMMELRKEAAAYQNGTAKTENGTAHNGTLQNGVNGTTQNGTSQNGTLQNGTAKKENPLDGIEMTLEVMTSQAFVFYVAGFETSSGVLSSCLLELAKHPDIQQTLREEINQHLEATGGEITYDMANKMPYLEKCVCEGMRHYPSLSVLFRQCTKDYVIPGTDVVIEKGTEVFIPTYGLQHDPQHYPNPDEFNPENFAEENKAKRHHYTYLPFGEGPRNCIGMRFGHLQVKLALIVMIKDFKWTVSPKMTFPVMFKSKTFVTNIEGGIWLTCSKV